MYWVDRLEHWELLIHEILRDFYIWDKFIMKWSKQVKKPTKRQLEKTRKQQMKKYDTKWSKLVKIKAWYKCEVDWCPKTSLNSHHIFSRNNWSTRFDLDNWVCLCSWHHTLNNTFSAHKTPTEFTEFIIKKRGRKRYNKLKLKANKIRDKDYDKIKDYLDTKEKELCTEFITKTK